MHPPRFGVALRTPKLVIPVATNLISPRPHKSFREEGVHPLLEFPGSVRAWNRPLVLLKKLHEFGISDLVMVLVQEVLPVRSAQALQDRGGTFEGCQNLVDA